MPPYRTEQVLNVPASREPLISVALYTNPPETVRNQVVLWPPHIDAKTPCGVERRYTVCIGQPTTPAWMGSVTGQIPPDLVWVGAGLGFSAKPSISTCIVGPGIL